MSDQFWLHRDGDLVPLAPEDVTVVRDENGQIKGYQVEAHAISETGLYQWSADVDVTEG